MNAIDVEILRTLRSTALHLPAAEIAAQLRVSLGEVQARLAGLGAAGFEIEQHPSLGFRLLTAPDRLIADDIQSRLGADAFIQRILVFEETDSTNDRAAHLGRDGLPEGVAVFAERQTAGRGRFGRKWESAAHRGLWFSLLLRPALDLAQWPRLTTWAAAGTAAAIESATGLATRIKWPNDLFLGDRKVAGILTETVFESGSAPFAIVGVGVNVNHEPGDFPAELRAVAGSLRIASGRLLDRTALAAAILRELGARHGAIATGFANLVAEATQRSVLLGKCITVTGGATSIEGRAEFLNDEGQLVLRTADGTLHTVTAGEVTIGSRTF